MPLYYTEGNDRLFARINEVCDAIEHEHGIRCSVHSRVLMFNTLSAITEDPSPEWVGNSARQADVSSQMIENFPRILSVMLAEAASDGRLTFYQTLHWLGENLNSICPFEKTPRRTRRART